ncbi:MAG: cyclic nucleotide-binding domain-containing protein [Conexivisphaerales archaeon]|jgi:CRP-like cAMP-binding protein
MEADPPGDFVDALGSTALFTGLRRKDLLTVVKLGKELSFRPGEKIVEAGEGGIVLFIILKGKVQMRREGRVLSELGRGDFFGEMAVLEGEPRPTDVTAIEPTRCFAPSRWSFEALVRLFPDVPMVIDTELARRLRDAEVASI